MINAVKQLQKIEKKIAGVKKELEALYAERRRIAEEIKLETVSAKAATKREKKQAARDAAIAVSKGTSLPGAAKKFGVTRNAVKDAIRDELELHHGLRWWNHLKEPGVGYVAIIRRIGFRDADAGAVRQSNDSGT